MHYPWPDDLQRLITQALTEDIGIGDVTAELIPADKKATAQIICRESATICGQDFFNAVFSHLDEQIHIDWHYNEGDQVELDSIIVTLTGNARSLLTGERTALNFLQTLSGIATVTHHYAQQLAGSKTTILDTRKTIPGLRLAEKYAVTVGGGKNHRMGLYDRVLIKENHILACGGITPAIHQARHLHPDLLVEVEVENEQELNEALNAQADIIMLDNFDDANLAHCVKLADRKAKLEVSGNVESNRLRMIAEAGVDYVSSGALTKHLKATDFSFRLLD